jgi:hypothetical protein
MKRTLIFLQFKIVNNYTNIKANFKFISAKYGILNLGIRSWTSVFKLFGNGSGACSFLRKSREMENISRGPTFGDFVTIRREASMQDVTVARLQTTRAQTPLSPLF